jgi:mycothiol system anti-sigma-R factor
MSSQFTCQEVIDLTSSFVDGELDSIVASNIAEHMVRCTKCLAHINFEKNLKESIAREAACEPAPEHLRQRVIQQISTVEWTSTYFFSQTIHIEIRSTDE